jgi:alpha-beta hydrolase superfamily lysophospholipase
VTVPRFLLALVCVLALPSVAAADERVDITATDGVQLVGDLAGTEGPGVVLAPAEHTTREAWRAAAQAIAARGFRTLRFDLRGNGDSSGSINPSAAGHDVEGAFRYLLARKIRPVFIIGDGVGGTAALTLAERVHAAGVVLLSSSSPADRTPPTVPTRALSVPVRSADDWKTGPATGAAIFADPAALDALVRFLRDPSAPPR